MQTEIIKIDRENIDKEALKHAGEVIKNGGLAAFPTETVYGLGGDAKNPESSKKIYAAKGRPSDNPLIVHIADFEDIKKISKNLPDLAKKLSDAFWPGPLTMIVEKNDVIPYETTGGLDTVAVRLPSDEVARELIRASGGFVAAPSANTSGRPSPTKAWHVIEDMDGKIDVIIDSGRSLLGLESTIVDLTVKDPVILRPGFITESMIRKVCEGVSTDPGIIAADSNVKPKAPGMKYRHYAPSAPVAVIEGEEVLVTEKIKSLISDARTKGQKVGILCATENENLYDADFIIALGCKDDEAELAGNLFDAMRRFDHEDIDVIYSEGFSREELGAALMNRLLKAAGHTVIKV
ncbi:MAG: threonylcarbamoyl-AMP synthase [Lachnospiraceae bacterium]|nr:threonylcarbamoyl-AMP synthase [Lachnospiraceae bacterium]